MAWTREYKNAYERERRKRKYDPEKAHQEYIRTRDRYKTRVNAYALAYYHRNAERIKAKWRQQRREGFSLHVAKLRHIAEVKYRRSEKGKIARKNITHVWRARKMNATVKPVDLNKVIVKCNDICGICKKHITGPFHFDHIFPLSKGGIHSEENLQIAHPHCNSKKGAKILLCQH